MPPVLVSVVSHGISGALTPHTITLTALRYQRDKLSKLRVNQRNCIAVLGFSHKELCMGKNRLDVNVDGLVVRASDEL